ncbi:MAG: cell division protein SepF [Oscillospiraceae bacterium]|jgi:cell division inhibitor SepF|nr:cell division protein SepF [Oscillospiraceae bacterium]
MAEFWEGFKGVLRDLKDDRYEYPLNGGTRDYDGVSDTPAAGKSAKKENARYDAQRGTARGGNFDGKVDVTSIFAKETPHVSKFRPRSYSDHREAQQIGDAICGGRGVLVVLESINAKDARRLLDFLAGVTFALRGVTKLVSANVYFFGPEGTDYFDSDDTGLGGEDCEKSVWGED